MTSKTGDQLAQAGGTIVGDKILVVRGTDTIALDSSLVVTGSGTGWDGEVANFAALPAATGSNEVYLVQASTGVLWGRRKGLYQDTGTWERLSNATFEVNDAESKFVDDADNTKKMAFQLDKISTGNTRTLTMADVDVDLGLLTTTQTTGWKFGGEISIGAGGPGVATTVDISAGEFQIVDTTVFPPTITEVSFAGATVTPTFILNEVNFYGVDTAGVVQQKSTQWTEDEIRGLVPVGISGQQGGVILLKIPQNTICYNVGAQLSDLRIALGNFNISGNVFSANGANLSLDKTAGKLFQRGGNYTPLSGASIDIVPQLSGSALSLFMLNQSGTATPPVTLVDTDNYDVGGVTTAIPNNKFVTHRIVLSSDNIVVVQRGQAIYSSMSEALSSIQGEAYVSSAALEGAVLRYFLIVKEGATALNNTSEVLFTEAVSGQAAGSGGISVTSLQGAYENSLQPQTVTDAIRGSVVYRQGSGADTDDVVEVQNGAGTQTFVVNGNGDLELSGTVDGRDVAADGLKLDDINKRHKALAGNSGTIAVGAAAPVVFDDASNIADTSIITVNVGDDEFTCKKSGRFEGEYSTIWEGNFLLFGGLEMAEMYVEIDTGGGFTAVSDTFSQNTWNAGATVAANRRITLGNTFEIDGAVADTTKIRLVASDGGNRDGVILKESTKLTIKYLGD